jgi:hypothetical protein
VERRADSPVTPDNPDNPVIPGPSIVEQLAIAIGPELQGSLPLATSTHRLPRGPRDQLRLAQVVGRLECADCTDDDAAVAIARLTGEFGPANYRPYHAALVKRIRLGQLAIGPVMDAIEEAMREGVANRGASFVAAMQRRGGGSDPEPATKPTSETGSPNRAGSSNYRVSPG